MVEFQIFLEKDWHSLRCVYMNGHRIYGRKQYASEVLPWMVFKVDETLVKHSLTPDAPSLSEIPTDPTCKKSLQVTGE